MPSPKETPRERRRRKRKEWAAENGGTPYADWPIARESCLWKVETAIKDRSFSWQKERTRIYPLTVEDMAVAYWAVRCVGEEGLSYGQLSRCFIVCSGSRCHSAKASAVLRALVALKLICKIGNYSVGNHGNVYRILAEGEQPPEAKQSVKRIKTEPRNDPSEPRNDPSPW